jgi:hypothetical protein
VASISALLSNTLAALRVPMIFGQAFTLDPSNAATDHPKMVISPLKVGI